MSKHSRGSIELICGSMFSGKTEEMIRRLRRAVIARQQVQAFKPTIDQRYHVEKVTSHNGLDFEAQPVLRAADILDALDPQTTVVAIDEAQFFDNGIIAVCDHLADVGIRGTWTGCRLSVPSVARKPAARSAGLRGDRQRSTTRWCSSARPRSTRRVAANATRY